MNQNTLSANFRVLVIEQDADLRKSLVANLRVLGFIADSQSTGEEGLYRAIHWDYDALIVAQKLPEMNGRSVVAELNEKKSIPVIMLSEQSIRMNIGAFRCISKPFHFPELLSTLQSLLITHKQKQSNILEAGTLRINTQRREVFLEDQLVPTTTKEYHFIELFVRKKGKVVTREYIYQHLFDKDDEDASNNLDVYIYKLRNKLGNQFVKTRRGLGYILESFE